MVKILRFEVFNNVKLQQAILTHGSSDEAMAFGRPSRPQQTPVCTR